MLARFVFFMAGIFIGLKFSPRPVKIEVPQTHLIESCKPQPVNVKCPDIKCDNEQILFALDMCYSILKEANEKISEHEKSISSLESAVKMQKEDSEYWRRKYVDFPCP